MPLSEEQKEYRKYLLERLRAGKTLTGEQAEFLTGNPNVPNAGPMQIMKRQWDALAGPGFEQQLAADIERARASLRPRMMMEWQEIREREAAKEELERAERMRQLFEILKPAALTSLAMLGIEPPPTPPKTSPKESGPRYDPSDPAPRSYRF